MPAVPEALRRGELPAFPEAPGRAAQIAALRASGPDPGADSAGGGRWDGLRWAWAWAWGRAAESPPTLQGEAPDAGAEEPYDLLVIGGGATGAGIALDAATRGLRVALVERGDFASGTSSKSTKLVHGGVRYLEKAVWELDYSQCVFHILHGVQGD